MPTGGDDVLINSKSPFDWGTDIERPDRRGVVLCEEDIERIAQRVVELLGPRLGPTMARGRWHPGRWLPLTPTDVDNVFNVDGALNLDTRADPHGPTNG